MSNKKFIVQYTGTGQGVSRSVVELPIDEKLEGRALDTKIRSLAEMKIKKSNRRDRGTIRIISIKPYNDSAEDSMDDKITSIAAKYGHEMQNDAIEGSQKAKDEQAIMEMGHKLAAMKNEYKKMAEDFARKYGDFKFTRFLK